MHFEELVNQPQVVMDALCRTFRLQYHPGLTKPYKDIDKKMVDGIYKDSKPMGDTRLLDHQDIDPKVAQNWKGVLTDNFLSDITWQLANSLGYETPDSVRLVDERLNQSAESKKSSPGTKQKTQAEIQILPAEMVFQELQ